MYGVKKIAGNGAQAINIRGKCAAAQGSTMTMHKHRWPIVIVLAVALVAATGLNDGVGVSSTPS